MKKTAIHGWHAANGAKMGEFAGYDMPLYYDLGVLKEHQWCREHAGLFDVSHMGQVILEGSGVVSFLERITPSGFAHKSHGRAQYTVLPNGDGGIIDDLIITRLSDDKFFAVLNAGCKDKDLDWIKSHLPGDVSLYHMQDHALIAVQGAWAERIIYEVLEHDATDMPYMSLAEISAADGTPVYLSRLGYTGEDGFEISVPNHAAVNLWEQLAAHSEAQPIGLAARDSLRLDMGYCLYGHDIDDTTSPVEADLGWVIRKDALDCIGSARINAEREGGVSRQRVGVKLTGKGVAREGAEILDLNGHAIGTLTSGGYSPSLEAAIGQGYVPADAIEPGTKVLVRVRGRDIEAELASMPFIPAKTKSMKKKAA